MISNENLLIEYIISSTHYISQHKRGYVKTKTKSLHIITTLAVKISEYKYENSKI
nr:MAG TPA: hypothetical protein [Bacteriophage sp.]